MSIVITGIGACSPLGCSFEESLGALREGKSRIDTIRNFPVDGYPYTAAGEIRSGGEPVRTAPGVDRKIHFLERSLEELSERTDFIGRYPASRLMMNIGTGIDFFEIEKCMEAEKIDFDELRTSGLHHNVRDGIRDILRRWHFDAGCHLFASACTASAQAIGLSWRILHRGLTGAIVTGGSDSMIAPAPYLGFSALGALSSADVPDSEKCRPCDLHSDGTVLGEASVTMLMEDSSNVPDSLTPLAEIIGYGSSMDAYSVTDPEPSGEEAAVAVQAALDEAGLEPEDIDCIHLHGTGTVKCAPAEYNCLKRIFGERLRDIPAYSMKGQVGHMIGSCTAVEMIGVVYSLQHQVVLPTVNFRTPHPEAPFRMVQGEPLHIPIRHILRINSAFGGHNTALVFRKWEA